MANQQTYYYPNYPFNDLNDDIFLSKTKNHYEGRNLGNIKQTYDQNKKRFTFHSPETHFYKPQLGNILKYEAEVHGKARGFFNQSQDFAKYRLLSEKHYDLAKAYAYFISSTVQDPTQEALIGLAVKGGSTIGGAIGGAVAGAVTGGAATGAGASLGSAVGNLFGSLIGTKVSNNLFSSRLFKYGTYMSSFEKILNLLKDLIEPVQYHYQHQSVGKYNQISLNTPRKDFILDDKEYLEEGKQTVKDSNTTILFNNYNRESSVYFKARLHRPNYTVVDNSRTLVSQNSSPASAPTIINSGSDLRTYVVRYDGNIYDLVIVNCNGTISNARLDGSPGWFGGLSSPRTRTFSCVKSVEVIGETSGGSIGGRFISIEIVDTGNCSSCTETVTVSSDYICSCNNTTEKNISSFYVSNKVYKPNQYGNIYDVKWLDLNSCSTSNCNGIYFGGDTFITRMSLKRKQDFFSRNTFKLNNDTDFNYSLVPNVAYPTYFFDTIKYNKYKTYSLNINFEINPYSGVSALTNNLSNLFNLGLFSKKDLVPPNYKLDCYNNIGELKVNTNKFRSASLQGLMYTYVYGIPYFLVESSINLDLRDSEENSWDKFYPEESNLELWLQENVTPIKQDNTYYYDSSFSKQATESFHYLYDVNFKGLQDCKTNHPQRVIYSAQALTIDDSNYSDNYLINKGLDYYDFPLEGGRLTSIDNLESNRILVRLANTSYIYGTDIRLNTDINTVLLSTGNLFSTPVQYPNASNGYFGSQHRAIAHTSEGHFMLDAKRGHVFQLGNGGQGLGEISNQGMRHWFKENLPFKIEREFPGINVDDNYNGIGITMCYDKRFNQLFITKLDYETKNADVRYDITNKMFYLGSTGQEVSLLDKKYFKNKSWTVSWSFYRKEWVSFHTFTPNYYIEEIDTFLSGNNQGVWQHNITNKSYQIFYNKLEPFIIETIAKGSLNYDVLKGVNYYADFIRYHNDFDFYYNLEQRFNKAIVYGKSANSGMLHLVPRSDNYRTRLQYPIIYPDRTEIEEVMKEQSHSFNQFKNRIKADYTHLPHWVNDSNNVDKKLNLQAFTFADKLSNDYIRDSNIKTRLIQDIESRYKIIFKGTILDLDPSIR